MLKVKMLSRFAGRLGKMERGLEYSLPADYAMELIDHGLAVLVVPPASPPVMVTGRPTRTIVGETARRNVRGQFKKVG